MTKIEFKQSSISVFLNSWVTGIHFWVAKNCITVVFQYYMGRQIVFFSVLWVANYQLLRTTGPY